MDYSLYLFAGPVKDRDSEGGLVLQHHDVPAHGEETALSPVGGVDDGEEDPVLWLADVGNDQLGGLALGLPDHVPHGCHVRLRGFIVPRCQDLGSEGEVWSDRGRENIELGRHTSELGLEMRRETVLLC